MSAINTILFGRSIVNISYIILIILAAFCTTYASTLRAEERFEKFVFQWNAFACVFSVIPGLVMYFGMGFSGVVLPILCYKGVALIMKSVVSLMGRA